MGNFAHHATTSLLVGAATATLAHAYFLTSHVETATIGTIATLSGLVPDIDSPDSAATEFILNVSSVVVPALLLMNVPVETPAELFLFLVASFVLARYLFRYVLRKVASHRGMIHSLPAVFIWGCLVFLGFQRAPHLQYLVGGSAIIGFASHLLVDEMFSGVALHGGGFVPERSSDSAFKVHSDSVIASVVAWALVAALVFLCLKQTGYTN